MTTSIKKNVLRCVIIIATVFATSDITTAQTIYQAKTVDILLTGTSSLHDWEMKAGNGTSEASLTVDANGRIMSVNKLSFTLPAKSLKSKHTVMDKNTYKALKTDDNPNLSFVLLTATVNPAGKNTYELTCVGKLTIAGTTKETDLKATAIYDPSDKSFKIAGIKKMKMTDYNVKPPTVMLGTIKTGNEISIAYNLMFSR